MFVVVNPDTPTPELTATTAAGGGSDDFVENLTPDAGVDGDEYLLEYCIGEPLSSIGITSTGDVRWYDENFNPLDDIEDFTVAPVGELGINTVGTGNRLTEQSVVFYFTEIDGTGCESDFRLVTVNVYDNPDVPQLDGSAAFQSGNIYTYDYCVEDDGTSTNPSPLSFDDLLENESYNIIRVFNDFSAGSSTINNTTRDGDGDTNDENIPVPPIFAGDTIIYTITKTENINRDAATSSFAGCTGSAITVRIIGHEEASDPNQLDFVAGTTEFNICEGDALGNISHTFIDGTDEYTWYESVDGNNMGQTRIGDILGVGDPMTETILGTASASVAFDANIPGVYTYYVSRNNDVIDARDFEGCESEAIPVTITVHAIQDAVSIVSDNSANASVLDLNDLDANTSDDFYEFAICSDQLFSDLTFVAQDLYVGDERVEWYNQSTGNLLFTGENPTYADLFLTGLGAQTVTFSVVQVTDTLTDSFGNFFDGCVSDIATFELTIADPEELTVVDDLDFEIDNIYCREDDPKGDLTGDLDIFLNIGGVFTTNPSGIDFQLNSYLKSTFDASGTPEVPGSLQNNTFPSVNLVSLHDAVTGSQAVGGEPTVHELVMFYEDPSTFCTGSVTKTFTIYPAPHISIEVDGVDINDASFSSFDEFCYEGSNVNLQGVQYIYDNTGITDTVVLISGQFSSNVTGNIGSDVGEGIFNVVSEHNAFHGVAGQDGKFLNQSNSVVTFEYTDEFGCFNSETVGLFVNPEAQVIPVTGLPATDLAATRTSNQIRLTNFCRDATSVDM
ncbi:MAG: hypothetical protein AAFY41_05920, partial [Bacteroidota bacterium]